MLAHVPTNLVVSENNVAEDPVRHCKLCTDAQKVCRYRIMKGASATYMLCCAYSVLAYAVGADVRKRDESSSGVGTDRDFLVAR